MLQADLMRAVLEAGAVPVFALNTGESLFAGMGDNSVNVALYVPEDQAERARQLLAAGEGNAD
jgi:hypothetical protein